MHDLSFGDVRDNWGQRAIDRLLEQVPDALLPEWGFAEERVGGDSSLEFQLRVTAPDGRVYVWVPSAYTPGSWAGPLRENVPPDMAAYLADLLEREESWADDYHQDRDDYREWAGRIDRARAALGLPLVERTPIDASGLPLPARAMTLVESLEAEWARVDGPREESEL